MDRRSPLRWPTVKRCTPSWVPSDVTFRIGDHAGARVRRPARRPLDEPGVVAVGHEADLVAVGLVGDAQAARACACSRTSGLGMSPTGNTRVRQLRLREREEEVRLVLAGVAPAPQPEPA